MDAPLQQSGTIAIRPPATSVGIIGWVRQNLFNGPLNSVLTIVVLLLFAKIAPALVKWALVDSLWTSTGAECKATDGACWSVVTHNVRFILFGFYPYDQQWRPLCCVMMIVGLFLYTREPGRWSKGLAIAWGVSLVTMGILMPGGILGLQPVEPGEWSGISLTLLLSLFGLTAAYPLGVILALGRRSKLPAIKIMSVLYIELIRGVPLISMLFMASVMFPLFLPEGITVDKILRAQVAIILFTAAYIAEVVRGGLQAIPRGQYEAAESLGLNYYQNMRLIILPQALKIVIPPTMGILISAFKDTSLVVIIGLFDLLKTTQVTLSNPEWMGFSTEAFLFIAILYFLGCFSMSSFSRRLEKVLAR
ncbi:MAG: amino acid ABC transporter permease [Syntrophobacteraceae bacterium]